MCAVDIVVPCYNACRTLEATVESAIGQDELGAVVVVDDGSADASLQLARAFEPRVVVLTGPNRGVAHARNRGAAIGSADWLLFLDSDDLLTPSTVARRLAVARATDADVVICDWDEFDDGDESQRRRPRSVDWTACTDDPECAVIRGFWAPPAAILYRRSLFEQTGGFRQDVSPVEDARMLFDAARLGARFAHAPHVGAAYRIAAGSLSRDNPARFWTGALRNGQQVEALWRGDAVLSAERERVIAGLYDNAARNLLQAAHPDFFTAAAANRRFGRLRSLHTRIAGPLAQVVGLAATRTLFRLAGRA